MTRSMWIIAAGLCLSHSLQAQTPLQQYGSNLPSIPYLPPSGAINPYNLMPNIYNPQTQPLSPYLNLLSGINPGVNYYYGVRPGTLGMSVGRGGGAPFVAPGGPRPLFFPQLAAAPDPLSERVADGDRILPPAGHPVVFNNTLGFFPTPLAPAGGARPALAGLGAARSGTRR
ncbi:MAG: hypothetical protein WHU94_01140 [Thermogemmata sp.]|uniref:Uncharacterized protein n=1 Tax=Thermogemmata fonticola TaxID=2755323 RepID=A0A7V8VC70_9BACT|nr:hypothetical protein [Thermogemmata fonticola]MBA2225334.1 hypothetical protein [Thermogemmata fonticola]MCX8139646.1 hypothetical protein [Gemmataceae bacterium]GIW84813.1 MAG: hypothetical protein KatS3mg107_0473 [Gemmataceae bacterium]